MSKQYELTFRRTKGSPVTSDEIDNNFKKIQDGHTVNRLDIDKHEDKLNDIDGINFDHKNRILVLETSTSDQEERLVVVENKILEDGFATQSYVDDAVSQKDNTDEITEGTTNLYYTDDRVQTFLTDNSYAVETWVTEQISVLTGVSQETIDDLNNLQSLLSDTDGLSEGTTNLYYTDARTDARVNLQTGANLDLSNKTTTDLVEGTNLYYTDARVADYLTANNYAQEDWVTNQITTLTGTVTELTTTDGITEGTTNLYYTDDRVRAAISVEGNLSYDPESGVISYTDPTTIEWTAVENKPTTVSGFGITDAYTKSETDAAITARVTEIADGEINLTGYATETYADATIDSKTTDDLTEGSTNLYYTEQRVADFLTDNNYATKLFVTTTVNNTIFQSSFAPVATSGSYTDLTDTPSVVSAFTNDSNYITLNSLSVNGDLSYDNTTGTISYSQPTNISVFTNDSNYLVDDDIRQEFTDITNRLDVLEEYTILDVYKNMYKNTTVDVQYLEFSIRLVDTFRMNWLASGQSDPAWDNLVDDIYNNDAASIEQAFAAMPVLDQTVFLLPLLYTINSGVTLVNQALGTTYDTVTLDELNNSFPQWQQRNSGYEASATALDNQLVQADMTFIKNILKNNSYADFTRDTVVTGWNPS